jgi:hypothetical protein
VGPDQHFSRDLAHAVKFGDGYDAPFNFLEFTGSQRFRLNVLPTTPFGRAWADILVKPENFLQCKGTSIALCYYSGPETPASPDALATPCKLVPGEGIANCTCYEIPAGPTYLVDINAILNLDVYLETIKVCGHDGSGCQPKGAATAPVCDAINRNTLIPGADLVSTFSLYLESTYPTQNGLTCGSGPYAGCMTAPCKRSETENVDPVTGLPLVNCAFPIATGKYQVGYPNGNACTLGDKNVWSAAFAPLQEMLPPPPPPPSHCWPDTWQFRAPHPAAKAAHDPRGTTQRKLQGGAASTGTAAISASRRLYLRCDAVHCIVRSASRAPGLRGPRE